MRKNHMAQVKTLLLTGQTITARDALGSFGCFRLASIIHRLRRSGMQIVNEGKPGGHAVYRTKRVDLFGEFN